MNNQYETETPPSEWTTAEVQEKVARRHLKGETVKKTYRVMVVQHEDGTWELAESEKLTTNFAKYKKTRQGKWRKLDKRRFSKEVMNTVGFYKTR